MPHNWDCCQACGKDEVTLRNVTIQTQELASEYTFCQSDTDSAKAFFKEKIVVHE
jgi:hypothetical protein